MANRNIPPGLLEAPSQRIYLADGTAIAVNSTVRAANPNVLMFSVETNNVRMRIDGAPTLTTGVLFTSGIGPYWYEGYDGTSALRFQRTTGAAVVNLHSFKQAGS